MSKLKLGLEYLNGLATWNGTGAFSLDSVRDVLIRLDSPQDSLPAVHIAGTNGKGSVSAAVAAILGAAGYRVGLNTSPHLQRINERFVVDGHIVDDSFIGEFAYEVRNVSARSFKTLSFHEALTIIAFLGFREVGVEWMVIEVGLGGRLDASNVISRPASTGIVTIDYDHQHILGNTLGEIAKEKAGIIKPGSPLITGSLGEEAERSIESVAKRHGVPWFRYRYDFGFEDSSTKGGLPLFWCRDVIGNIQQQEFKPTLQGKHQLHNMAVATAMAASMGIPIEACTNGLQEVFWPGRLESFQLDKHTFLMDCAHNPAGVRAFMSFLESIGVSRIDITFGVLDTKDWEVMVELLAPIVSTWRLLRPTSSRALSEDLLMEQIRRVSGPDISIINYADNFSGWLNDILESDPTKFYALTGSMYLIGQLRTVLGVPCRPLWVRK